MNKLTRYSRNLGLTAGILLCAGLATAPAMASSITFTFTGTVTEVGHKLREPSPGPFSVDQSATGSYTFNPDTPNTGSGNTGEYHGALDGPSTNFNVTIGTYVASLGAGATRIEVIDNPHNFRDESYEVEGVFSGAPVNWQNPKSFQFDIEHPSSNQFNGISLPLTSPSVSSFDVRTLRLVFGYGGDDRTVIVTLNEMTPVPLPPAVILFGAGLVSLIGLGARNRQRGQKIGVLGSKL